MQIIAYFPEERKEDFIMSRINWNEEKEYKEKIIEMVKEIENRSIIKLLYYYVQSGYREEKAGTKTNK